MNTQLNDINLTLHKLGNFFHSILLLIGMESILSLLGWLFAGLNGMKWSDIKVASCQDFFYPATASRIHPF